MDTFTQTISVLPPYLYCTTEKHPCSSVWFFFSKLQLPRFFPFFLLSSATFRKNHYGLLFVCSSVLWPLLNHLPVGVRTLSFYTPLARKCVRWRNGFTSVQDLLAFKRNTSAFRNGAFSRRETCQARYWPGQGWLITSRLFFFLIPSPPGPEVQLDAT